MSAIRVFVRDGVARNDRSVLHDAIGAVSGYAPSAVEVEYRCVRCGLVGHGKPNVVTPAGYFASLSRSGQLVAVAVTDAGPIGIDITNVAAVSRADVGAVLRHPEDDAVTPVEIARSWAAKEAVLKATGWGLHVEASGIAIAAGVVEFWPAELELDEAPGLAYFEVGAGVVGAVAVLGGADLHVDLRRLERDAS